MAVAEPGEEATSPEEAETLRRLGIDPASLAQDVAERRRHPENYSFPGFEAPPPATSLDQAINDIHYGRAIPPQTRARALSEFDLSEEAVGPPATSGKPIPQGETARLDARREELVKQREEESNRLFGLREQSGARYERDITAIEAEIKNQSDYAQALIKQEEARNKELPEWKPEPPINPQDFMLFGMQLIAMALVGGLRGSGGWQRAASAIDGSLAGYLQGSKEKMEYHWQQYQQEYKRALDMQKQQQKEFEDTLRSNELSTNQKIRELQNTAARYEREDVRQQGEIQHTLDGYDRQITSVDEARARVEVSNARIEATMTAMRERMSTANANATLTPEAYAVASYVDEITGKPGGPMTRALYSKYSREFADPAFNMLVVHMKADHPDASLRDIAGLLVKNGAANNAIQQALNVQEKREAAVRRLTESITKIEGRIRTLAAQANLTNVPWVNITWNTLRSGLGTEGSAEYIEFQNLIVESATQYMEAITMPGSSAQMHATTAEAARQLLSPNMTMEQIDGVFRAWNTEITITTQSLTQITRDLLEKMVNDPMVSKETGTTNSRNPNFKIYPDFERRSNETSNTLTPHVDDGKTPTGDHITLKDALAEPPL